MTEYTNFEYAEEWFSSGISKIHMDDILAWVKENLVGSGDNRTHDIGNAVLAMMEEVRRLDKLAWDMDCELEVLKGASADSEIAKSHVEEAMDHLRKAKDYM